MNVHEFIFLFLLPYLIGTLIALMILLGAQEYFSRRKR